MYVEVPEHIDKPIYVENVIEREIPVYMEKIVEVPREVVNYIERPVERVEYIDRDVPVERQVQRIEYVDHEVHVENVIRRPRHVEVVREIPVETVVECPVYIDVEIEKHVHVPIERIVEREIEVIIERPIYETIEHQVERIVECPIYIDNIIEQEVVEQRYIDNYIEEIIEQEVVKENIIRVPREIERVVVKEVDNIIEQEVPIYKENIIEQEVEVIVERPVTIERVVEEPVYIEVEVPIINRKIIEVENCVDVELRVEFDECCFRIRELHENYEQLCAELDLMTQRWAQCNEMPREDYMKLCREIRHKIASYEIEISLLNAKMSQSSHSIREKVTTVFHHQDPKGRNLHEQILKLEAENKALNDKIQFHDFRISVGTHNYAHCVTSVVNENGGVVLEETRELRKSQRNSQQNERVTISPNKSNLRSEVDIVQVEEDNHFTRDNDDGLYVVRVDDGM